MTFKRLSFYLNNEDKAEEYLIKEGILNSFDKCIKCGSSHLGRVRRGKIMCYECKAEWNIRKGSFLEGKKVKLNDFIGCLKFFADGINAAKCANELEVSPKLTRRIFNELRTVILGNIRQILEDVHEITFHIREVDGQILFEVRNAEINTVTNATLVAKRSINSRREFIYDITYKSQKVKSVMKRIERIDSLDNFYRFCKERLLTFRGRETNYLVAVLEELAFRYNHRREDILNILIYKIAHEK